MSHEQSLNEFSFQTIANVNFTNKASIVDALNELKESGATTVLLIIQPENAYKLMGMVIYLILSFKKSDSACIVWYTYIYQNIHINRNTYICIYIVTVGVLPNDNKGFLT